MSKTLEYLLTLVKEKKIRETVSLRSDLPEEQLISFFQALKTDKRITSLKVESFKYVERVSGGKKRDIIYTLTPRACSVLAEALLINDTLTHLDLSSNGLDCTAIEQLAMGLKTNKGLKSLNLNYNMINERGACELASVLLTNNNLQTLELNSNYVRAGAVAIAFSVGRNNTLKHLNLAANLISNENARSIFRVWKDYPNLRLENLSLGTNQISDTAVYECSEFLKSNRHLTELHLNNNFINMEGLNYLTAVMSINKTLRTLNLRVSEGIKPHALEGTISAEEAELRKSLFLCRDNFKAESSNGVSDMDKENDGPADSKGNHDKETKRDDAANNSISTNNSTVPMELQQNITPLVFGGSGQMGSSSTSTATPHQNQVSGSSRRMSDV